MHSWSTHHYANGGLGEVFESTKHFWSLWGKQCCSSISPDIHSRLKMASFTLCFKPKSLMISSYEVHSRTWTHHHVAMCGSLVTSSGLLGLNDLVLLRIWMSGLEQYGGMLCLFCCIITSEVQVAGYFHYIGFCCNKVYPWDRQWLVDNEWIFIFLWTIPLTQENH